MTALHVFLGLTAFNTLLMFFPVTFRVSFRERFGVQVRFLFFHYTIAPRPPKPEKKKEREKKPEKKEPFLKRLFKQQGLFGFLSIFTEVAKIAAGTAKRLFRHLTVGDFLLDIAVAADDAAQTAMQYARVCAAVGTAAGLFFGAVRYRSRRICIVPDFRSKKSRVLFQADLKIRLMFLISAALYAALRSFKLFKKIKNNPSSQNTQEKAVLSHGGSSN
ncbi:MAG TPA: hypothetical protein DEB16_03925 [Ruminococcaceae bacterium]|jgi:hypothetical protein|nr:hypothetical protein [Oscillospiraceae bacterium]HBQ47069.1 hypothetical protein [Oscillospiraceae bacterium]HBT90977.1 hypothetical protein [Oscillospiraceae bacterium]